MRTSLRKSSRSISMIKVYNDLAGESIESSQQRFCNKYDNGRRKAEQRQTGV
jgi:hypothetical protein